MAKPSNAAPLRTPKSTDIQPGETQFLRYNNGYIRGKWNGLGGVAITWHSGFATSCNADEWNDREFLDKPEKAALIDPSEIPSAHAWFHKVAEEARKSLFKSKTIWTFENFIRNAHKDPVYQRSLSKKKSP